MMQLIRDALLIALSLTGITLLGLLNLHADHLSVLNCVKFIISSEDGGWIRADNWAISQASLRRRTNWGWVDWRMFVSRLATCFGIMCDLSSRELGEHKFITVSEWTGFDFDPGNFIDARLIAISDPQSSHQQRWKSDFVWSLQITQFSLPQQ